jgi:hypothetical protein
VANTLLTPQIITREALRILHAKLNFIKSINRQYDDRFAQAGAKIGATLQIRKPPRYTVSTGAALATQDTTDTFDALTIATQKHVDTTFSSVELTLSVDDFSKRILEPSMAQLASAIEADSLTMYQQVYNTVGAYNTPVNSLATVLRGRKRLNDLLTPLDGQRTALLTTDANLQLVSALQGLFQDSSTISEQYDEGMMGRTAGFTFKENTLIPVQTTGTPTGTPVIAGAGQIGSSLATSGWTASTLVLNTGDVFTIPGVYAVHPETRIAFGYLQQFTVTAPVTSTAGGLATIPISPSIVLSPSPFQTVSVAPPNGNAIVPFASVTAPTPYSNSLLFHKDAFTFATADLEDVSQYGAWGSRQQYDGISMRIARQYAIGTDTVPCRIDVLYGYVPLYPQLACRVAGSLEST